MRSGQWRDEAQLGEGGANLLATVSDLARLFFQHRLLGLDDEKQLELPIAADALGTVGAEPFGNRGDLAPAGRRTGNRTEGSNPSVSATFPDSPNLLRGEIVRVALP